MPCIKGCSPIPPDFLFSPVGLTSFMRLSLMKAAHAVTESRAQEIRVSRFFLRDVGDTELDLGP